MSVDQLKNMLNWQLMAGSHEWPGPDGGTCINEAAIVAAGMPYRRVTGPSTIPVCFSRIIATFLMALNDRMDLKARQDLIEFIPRLAGSADNYKIEFKRAEYIIIQSFSKVFPCYLMKHHPRFSSDYISGIIGCKTLDDITKICNDNLQWTYRNELILYETVKSYRLATRSLSRLGGSDGTDIAQAIAGTVIHCNVEHHEQYLNIVRGALAIGRQADPIETETIIARADKIRKNVSESVA